MKRVVSADSTEKLHNSDITTYILDAMDAVSALEDYYLGESCVDDFTRCYQFLEKALAAFNRANDLIK